jgi:predicted metal-dependent enzyme (double-stranded beta helix superfamily)
MDRIVGQACDEAQTLDAAAASLRALLQSEATWLPETHRAADATRYQQHALYVDPQSRYSVVSFVWGPGQSTPVHDHTVWGLVGVLEGAEVCEEYVHAQGWLRARHAHDLRCGEIDRVSPTLGDVHKVSNAHADRVSMSIHVYGGDIGRIERHIYEADGTIRPFVSGYSHTTPWITP